ncbi:polyhydroxyalkanoate depolymerase [Psychrobium sp. MM17-31]|uniref:polyhydroxyalkanoate depolymerase n=1 Tax=Psychrobium sp. MM17-31 TaxID=2917758 RepID=UPI001EF48BE3|nr:polyhydroxyalkanoate depolymerase [Psychrobium sp. MM17-31]MCG7530638.1 polyhydroxyalkanoate depolymerase [Psychrobium sp. MM17-31]
MRYQSYDYFSRSAQLFHDGFSAIHDVSCHPLNPFSYTPIGRLTNAVLESSMRLTRRYDKLDFSIDSITIGDNQVKIVEEIVENKVFCDLLKFSAQDNIVRDKVLLVAPLSGHHATLLKGTVEGLLVDHDVYITDWQDARDIPLSNGPFSFDCYVTYLIEFLEFLGDDVHMVAICQPTVQSLIATAVLAERNSTATPKSLTLMAGPIDVSKSVTRVNELAHQKPLDWFKNNAIMTVPAGYPGVGRKVYPGFLQLGGFLSMNPEAHAKKHMQFFQNILFGEREDAERFRAFYDEYMAVLDMPAEFYLETIERVFQGNELANGKITYRGKPVDFSAIKDTALLTVEGEMDDIVGIGQTRAAQDICPNIPQDKRQHHEQEGAGHYGIFSGSKFRKYVRPMMTEFIKKYS